MFDFTDDEKAHLREMASVGHNVTDRGAALLRRVHDMLSGGAGEPEEYPKMVYPEGMVHDGSAEPHLVGSPKGVVVHSVEEERDALSPPVSEPAPEPV